MLRAAFALILIGSAGYAAPVDRDAVDAGRLDKALSNYVAGAPQSCLGLTRPTLSSRTYGSTVIYGTGNRIWRTELVGGCRPYEHDALITRTTQSRSCRGDIVEVRDLLSNVTRGSCSFGDFVEYRRR